MVRPPHALQLRCVLYGEAELVNVCARYDPPMKFVVAVRGGTWVTAPKSLCKVYLSDDVGFEVDRVRFERTGWRPTGYTGGSEAPRFVTREDYQVVPPGEEVYVDSPRFLADTVYAPEDAPSIPLSPLGRVYYSGYPDCLCLSVLWRRRRRAGDCP